MTHRIYRVESFEVVGTYTLRVRFDDATEQTINFEAVLAGELFQPLRDPAVFKQARIDPEVHTLVWPNGADFDPETLHDWPQHAERFAALARQWRSKGPERGDVGCKRCVVTPTGIDAALSRVVAQHLHPASLPSSAKGGTSVSQGTVTGALMTGY